MNFWEAKIKCFVFSFFVKHKVAIPNFIVYCLRSTLSIELGPKEVFLVALGKLWGPPKPKLCKNSMGIITGTPEVYMRHVSNKAWSFNSL